MEWQSSEVDELQREQGEPSDPFWRRVFGRAWETVRARLRDWWAAATGGSLLILGYNLAATWHERGIDDVAGSLIATAQTIAFLAVCGVLLMVWQAYRLPPLMEREQCTRANHRFERLLGVYRAQTEEIVRLKYAITDRARSDLLAIVETSHPDIVVNVGNAGPPARIRATARIYWCSHAHDAPLEYALPWVSRSQAAVVIDPTARADVLVATYEDTSFCLWQWAHDGPRKVASWRINGALANPIYHGVTVWLEIALSYEESPETTPFVQRYVIKVDARYYEPYVVAVAEWEPTPDQRRIDNDLIES